jgi:DNA-directed RNA polymerase sigma subunit (sigma70/sigma32)
MEKKEKKEKKPKPTTTTNKRVKRETISRERVRQIQEKAFAHARKRLMEMGIFEMKDIL